MPVTTISQLAQEALKNEKITSEELSDFESVLRENLRNCVSQSTQSIFVFITAIVAWVFIKSAFVEKVNILNIEIKDVKIALLVLPIIAAFAFYQHQSAFALASLIDNVLHVLHKKRFPVFTEKHLNELLTTPSIGFVENSLDNLYGSGTFLSTISILWLILVFIGFTLLPAIVLIWMSIVLIIQPVYGLGVTLLFVLLIVLFVLRSLSIFVYMSKLGLGL